MTDRTTRRQLIQLAGTAAVGSFAGCVGILERRSGTDETTTGTTSTTAPTPNSTPASDATATPAEQESSATESTATETSDSGGYELQEAADLEPPRTSLADVAIPENPDEFAYATMGTGDAPTTATVFGSWKCPYTREFVLRRLGALVETYVAPGDLAIEFRAVAHRSGEPLLGPDAPRAARAGLAVWNRDPGAYWGYFESVFENQPQERFAWATTDQLREFGTAADVSTLDEVEKAIEGGSHASAVEANAAAAAAAGVYTVPRLVVDGEVAAPTVDFEATTELLEEVTG